MTEIPENCLFNKRITGCGATELAIRNSIDTIIAMPYVSLVKNNYKPSLPSCPKCFVEKYLEGLIDEIMDAKSLSNEVKYSILHKIGMLVAIACDGGCVDTADAWNFMDAYVAINVKTQIAKQQNK
jgi:hypothetical protein